MKRYILATILLALVALICGGLIWFNFFRDQMIAQFFANMPRPSVTISSIEVKPQSWTPGIDAVGTVSAAQGVDLAVQVGGIVKKIDFKANDKVAAGQLLVQIDDAVDRAGLVGARSSVAVSQDALGRAKTLLERNVSSIADLQIVQKKLDQAEGTLAQIEATIDLKAIKAPFAGTIGIPRIDLGQYLQPGTVIATLQDLDRMKVNFTVPEQQLGHLQVGQTARFGLTDDKMDFTGTVTGIDPKIDPTSRLVSVQAIIDNTGDALRPGQFVHARVNLPQEDNVIALPQTAVTISLYGSYVYVIEEAPVEAKPAEAKPAEAKPAEAKPADGKPADEKPAAAAPAADPAPKLVVRQAFVKTGRRDGSQIEILEGVVAGQKVVTSGQNKLSNGTTVLIDNSVDPAKGELANAAGQKS